MGLPFGAGWGFLMWLFFASLTGAYHDRFLLILFAIASVLAGVLFGFATAAHYRETARSLKLPEWRLYGNSH